MTDFAVGDRVEYTNENYYRKGPRAGDIGTVIRIIDMDTCVTVQFDDSINGGHSADGHGMDGHCWRCVNANLERIKEDKPTELSDAEISALLYEVCGSGEMVKRGASKAL